MKTHTGMFIKTLIFIFFLIFLYCEKKIIIEDTKDWIAFDRFDDNGNFDIWLLNLNGGEEIRVTKSAYYWEESPVWLSDSEIVYLIEPPPASFTEKDIVVVNLKTGKQELLDFWNWHDCPGVWKVSADSKRNIYYTTNSLEESEIFIIPFSDRYTNSKIFVSPAEFRQWGLKEVRSPVISLDGKELLFAACDTLKYRLMHIEQKKFYDDIYLYNLQIDSLKRLTFGDYSNGFPSWIGRDSIIFSSNCNGNWELYLMNRDGKILRRLTYTESIDEWQGATVSPDHKFICYSGYDNEKKELYIWLMHLEDGKTKFLTKGGNPAWSPKK